MKNVVDTTGPASRLIIADAVMPPAGLLSRAQEAVLRSFEILTRVTERTGEGRKRWKVEDNSRAESVIGRVCQYHRVQVRRVNKGIFVNVTVFSRSFRVRFGTPF